MNRCLAPVLMCLPLLVACQPSGEAQNRPVVTDARIALPAVRGRPGAGYFTIRSSAKTRLINVSSPRVKRMELHESMAAGMAPLRDAEVGAGDSLEFAPGGRHAMLFDVDPALRIGDKVPLTFTFDTAASVTVEAAVQGPGGGNGGR